MLHQAGEIPAARDEKRAVLKERRESEPRQVRAGTHIQAKYSSARAQGPQLARRGWTLSARPRRLFSSKLDLL